MVSHLRRHPAGRGALQVGVMNFAERDPLGSLAMASIEMDKTKREVFQQASVRTRTRCRHLVAVWCHCDYLAGCCLVLPGLSLGGSALKWKA